MLALNHRKVSEDEDCPVACSLYDRDESTLANDGCLKRLLFSLCNRAMPRRLSIGLVRVGNSANMIVVVSSTRVGFA